LPQHKHGKKDKYEKDSESDYDSDSKYAHKFSVDVSV
jgi:hypothetical protein